MAAMPPGTPGKLFPVVPDDIRKAVPPTGREIDEKKKEEGEWQLYGRTGVEDRLTRGSRCILVTRVSLASDDLQEFHRRVYVLGDTSSPGSLFYGNILYDAKDPHDYHNILRIRIDEWAKEDIDVAFIGVPHVFKGAIRFLIYYAHRSEPGEKQFTESFANLRRKYGNRSLTWDFEF